MEKDYAVVIAWPETKCKQTGAWYDPILNLASVAKSGYYKVGHAAVVLINGQTKEMFYFDFGRYHAPKGFGRVRSAETDHDLKIKTWINFKNDQINNLDSILKELIENKSCHGDGLLIASVTPVYFKKSYDKAIEMQEREFIKYGPFIFNGTNCSRFVNTVIRAGSKRVRIKLALKFPWMLSPTPKYNVQASGKIITLK